MNKTWNLKEMKKLIPLALPVLVVNLSIVGMGAVDAIVAGRAGVTDMAAVALGSSVYLPVALFACGVLMIIGPVIANMRGKSHESRVGYMTNHGLWLALMLSLVSMPVIYVLRNVFGWISDDAAMCRMASAYMFAIMWGLPANLGFVALKSLNEGSNMTRPAMYVGLCGLLLNIPLNYMFVFGMYGFPRMGGAGCGAATAVIFYIEFLLMFLLVYFNPKHRPYRRHIISWRRPTPSVITHLVRLGVPIGVSQLCEVMLFCAAALVLAPLGETQVASHQIAGNVGGLVFMLPLSVGLAASIRVAYHHGRNDLAGTRSAILSSYVLVLTICLCTFGGITLFREQIVHLYNDSELIVSTASVLLVLAAAYQLPDCLQVLSVGVLRGFRDTASITFITFFSYWMVGFPACYILARTDWIVPAMGARGIWTGFIIGLSVAAVLLLCEDDAVTEQMNRLARQIKLDFYGSRIVIFAPLYLSNYCVNGCTYCPYHAKNKHISRKKLSQEDIVREVTALQDMGHKRLAIEAGEDPLHNPISYILECIDTIYHIHHKNGAIRRVKV